LSSFRPSPNYIRGGLTVNGEWNDGYLGNNEFIPLLTTDFNVRNYATTPSPQGGLGRTSIEGFVTTTDGATAVQIVGGGGKASMALKIIPKGYEAYAFIIHGSVTPYIVDVCAGSLGAALVSDPPIATGAQNITHDFSTPIVGTDAKADYAVVRFEPNTTSDEIYGGKIFIRKQS